MGNILQPPGNGADTLNLTAKLDTLDAKCQNCAPLSPLECITRCQVYKLKNELRKFHENMENPNYIKELFNALKNRTRIHILQAIVNREYSLSQLQQELKKIGRSQSQDTIQEEYLQPLVDVGLVTESQDKYCATIFGERLTILLGSLPEFTEILPSHSECHEETLLCALKSSPKTFQEIENIISPKIVSRILKRLRSVGLIVTPEVREYVFFFKSKRDPSKEILTVTQQKIYDKLSYKGISVRKLAKETGLSIRRTYKHLRALKGKKLVFIRRIPKTYNLTCKGKMISSVLIEVQQIVDETWCSSQQFVNRNYNA